jgi:hypothetical protein
MGKRFADKVDLDEMKGYMCKTTLANYGYELFDKELIASIVFSAKDYKPHVILSVKYNGVTQHFGTDAKKAINYYNSL